VHKLLAILATAAMLFTVEGFMAGAAQADSLGTEGAFVAAINSLRVSKGLPTLAVDDRLTSVARAWSQQMAGAQLLSHNPNLPAQGPAGWRSLGENVGVGPSVAWLEAAFEASPHHYENLVDPSYTAIGVGVVEANGQIWVTEDFMGGAAAPTASAPAPAPVPSVHKAPAGRAPKRRKAPLRKAARRAPARRR
jgi:uncharacterized protein YkwD